METGWKLNGPPFNRELFIFISSYLNYYFVNGLIIALYFRFFSLRNVEKVLDHVINAGPRILKGHFPLCPSPRDEARWYQCINNLER